MYLIDYKRRPRVRIKERLSTETHKTVRLLVITLGIMILILGGLFLNTSSRAAQKGNTLIQLKDQNKELKSENAGITAKITSSTSTAQLHENNQVNSMETKDEKFYITEEDNRVN